MSTTANWADSGNSAKADGALNVEKPQPVGQDGIGDVALTSPRLPREPKSRRQQSMWLPGYVAASLLLFLCYVRVSGTVPVTADGGNNAMQACCMATGCSGGGCSATRRTTPRNCRSMCSSRSSAGSAQKSSISVVRLPTRCSSSWPACSQLVLHPASRAHSRIRRTRPYLPLRSLDHNDLEQESARPVPVIRRGTSASTH
jgi:hypothetical protein